MHDLLIPYAVLNEPPLQGVELKTTQAMFHMHQVVLTQEQLIIMNQGGTVNKKAGSHLFVIALAKREDRISGVIRKSALWERTPLSPIDAPEGPLQTGAFQFEADSGLYPETTTILTK